MRRLARTHLRIGQVAVDEPSRFPKRSTGASMDSTLQALKKVPSHPYEQTRHRKTERNTRLNVRVPPSRRTNREASGYQPPSRGPTSSSRPPLPATALLPQCTVVIDRRSCADNPAYIWHGSERLALRPELGRPQRRRKAAAEWGLLPQVGDRRERGSGPTRPTQVTWNDPVNPPPKADPSRWRVGSLRARRQGT